jgi:hypothetical protein
MRTDQVGNISIYVLGQGKSDVEREEEVGYRFWVSVGDFFHLLLSDSTPITTLDDLQSHGDGGGDGEREKERGDTKLIPLTVGLKIMKEITQEGISAGATKALDTFRGYLEDHKEEIEVDYDTEKEEG